MHFLKLYTFSFIYKYYTYSGFYIIQKILNQKVTFNDIKANILVNKFSHVSRQPKSNLIDSYKSQQNLFNSQLGYQEEIFFTKFVGMLWSDVLCIQGRYVKDSYLTSTY